MIRSNIKQDTNLVQEYYERARDIPTKTNEATVEKMKQWFLQKHKREWKPLEQQRGKAI